MTLNLFKIIVLTSSPNFWGNYNKLTSSMGIPHFKKGKRLYFKKSELVNWVSTGKIKTMKDIELEVVLIAMLILST